MRKFSEEEASNPQHTSSTASPTQEQLEILLYWLEEELKVVFPDKSWYIHSGERATKFFKVPFRNRWAAPVNSRQGIQRIAVDCGWSIAELATRKLPTSSRDLDLWRIHFAYRLLCRMSDSHCLPSDFLIWTPPYSDVDWSTSWNKSLLTYAHILTINPEIVRLADPHFHLSLNDLQVHEMDYDPFTFFAVKASMRAYDKFYSE